MPKLPKKLTNKSNRVKQTDIRVSSRQLAERIYRLIDTAYALVKELQDIQVILHTTGLCDCGPVVEDKNDIPF
jgi:hypothetical protein